MTECLVDVLNDHDTVLHVFPVVVDGQHGAAGDAECVQKALDEAAHMHLVPEAEIGGLHARLHVGRGGQLAPLGDVLQVRQESIERAWPHIRTQAYFLWQQEGCPENRAEEHWFRACESESLAV